MNATSIRLLRCAAMLMAFSVGGAAWAAGRCIDEDSAELRAGDTAGMKTDAGTARAALQDMVQEALRHSNAIGAARLLAEAAAIDVKEANSGRWPQVSLNGSIGAQQTKVSGIDEGSGKQGRIGLNLSAPLYDGGRTNDLTDWRKNLAEAARYGEVSTKEQVALQTVSLAIERSRYRLQVQIYQQYSRKMGCLVEALETIVRSDKGRASELVQAQKNLQQAEISQAQTLSTVRQIETRLRRFVGDGLPPTDGLSSVLLRVPVLTEVVAQAENSADISQLAAQADAADAYSRSVKALQKPQFNFVVSGNRTAGSGDSTVYSAGVNVSMPLYNPATGYAADSSRKRAEAARLQRAEALEARRFRIAEVHEQANSSFDRAKRIVDVLRDSDRVRNFTLQQWQQLGRRSLFDVMSAEGEHYSLRVAYVNALFDGEQSNALLWSLGSGVLMQLQ